MYCRMCGNPVKETDTVCKVCGCSVYGEIGKTPAAENAEEKVNTESTPSERVELKTEKKSSPPIHNDEFSWNIYDFSRPKKVEALDMEWPKQEEPTRKESKENTDARENWFKEMQSAGFARTEKTESTERVEQPSEILENLAPKKQEIEQVTDKFFTFSQKNEEFQKLLDREYEKLQQKKEGKPEVESDWKFDSELQKPETIETKNRGLKIGESPSEALEKMILGGTKPMEEPPEEGQKEVVEEPQKEDREKSTAFLKEEHPGISEMEKAREKYFHMLDEEMGGVQVKVEVKTGYGQSGKVVADVDIYSKSKEDREGKVGQTVRIEKKADPIILPEETIVEADIVHAEPLSFPNDSEGIHMEPEKEEKPRLKFEPQTEQEQKTITEAVPEKKREVEKPNIDDIWPINQEECDTEEETGKDRVLSILGKVLLILISTVIALEIMALGIRYFAPNSKAAAVVYDIQARIVEKFTGENIERPISPDADKEDGIDAGTDPNENEEIKPGSDTTVSGEAGNAGKTESAPMSDKMILVEGQLYKNHNKNIKSIGPDSGLLYSENKNYGKSDINDSKPIENNIWYTDSEDQLVYYDQEIVGTIIAYDSQWIDYVNNGNKDVLQLTKENSRAYKSAKGFSKIGKIQENFQSLGIGEIRQGENGFYIWTQEKISVTEKGKTKQKDYKWVYCLEVVDQKLKITDFIAYE